MMNISDMRMRELAEKALSHLFDNDMLEDFMEDCDIEFTDEEDEYFGFTAWE